MKSRCMPAAIMIAVILCLPLKALSSSVTIPFDGLPKIELGFDLGGEGADWRFESRKGNNVRYVWQDHSLDLKLEEKGIQQILRFTLTPPAGKQLSLDYYAAKITLPAAGLHAVMAPNQRQIAQNKKYYQSNPKWSDVPPIYHNLVTENFEEPANANNDAPYIQITDDVGNNAFSAGWANADTSSLLRGTRDGDKYVLELIRNNDVPFAGEKFEDSLIICSEKKLWFDVTRAYAKSFDGYNKRKHSVAPSWVYEPVFCTWYCYGDHIDQELCLKSAKKCKELGFGTYLIDAGWDCPSDGGYARFQGGDLGDFVAVKDRFPDMPGAIKQLHDMGLRAELWCAPFWQGNNSRAYKEKTTDWHVRTADGENYNLCPRHPEMRDYLKERFTWVAKTYGIDGVWFDAADSVPPVCIADHGHIDKSMGDAFVDCMAAVRDGLRSVNPKAILELRVLHGNLNSKIAFDIVQPSDAPNNLDTIRAASVHIRSWAHDVVVKSDPLRWGKNAGPGTIGKFLATSICCGVPALSVDFLNAPEEHCTITKAWFDFYREHRDTFVKGNFRPFGADYANPDMMLTGKDEAVVYLRNPYTVNISVPQTTKRIIILNCTASDNLKLRFSSADGKWNVQSYNPDWTKAGDSVTVNRDGYSLLGYTVPQGGAAVIE